MKIKFPSKFKRQKYLNWLLFCSLIFSIWYITKLKEQNVILIQNKDNQVIEFEKLKADINNIKEGLGLKGESIYGKTKYKDIIKNALKKTEDYYYLTNLSDYQKQLYRKEHGENYKLRYDWMINPIINSYLPLKGCEFGTPRMDSKGEIWGHTGIDQKSVDTTDIVAPCDSVVSKIGYDINGGYCIILKTIKQEINLKTGKTEDVLYENYLGHISEIIKVIPDQEIKQGESIAIMSNTGKDQCGVHCHWSIKRNGVLINPVINSTWNNPIIEKIHSSNYNY